MRILSGMEAPTIISSERQHEHYLSVLDRLTSRGHRSQSEEKYAELLVTLIEAYEEEHFAMDDAPPVEVMRALMDANGERQTEQTSAAEAALIAEGTAWLKPCPAKTEFR